MQWWWRRRRNQVRWSAPDRLPDGDTVPVASYRRWADMLGEEPTEEFPVEQLRVPPYLRTRR